MNVSGAFEEAQERLLESGGQLSGMLLLGGPLWMLLTFHIASVSPFQDKKGTNQETSALISILRWTAVLPQQASCLSAEDRLHKARVDDGLGLKGATELFEKGPEFAMVPMCGHSCPPWFTQPWV